jgi:subtilisin family serine protease
MAGPLIHQYVTFPSEWLGTLQADIDLLAKIDDGILAEIAKILVAERRLPKNLGAVVGYPTSDWRLCVPGMATVGKPSFPVAALTFDSKAHVDAFLLDAQAVQGVGIGTNPGAAPADCWCPVGQDADTFGTRLDARKQIRAEALKGLSGRGVNVVIVDRGLDKSRIPARNFGGGWCYRPPGSDRWLEPGTTTGEDAEHGMMIAGNILDVAPEALLFDLPVIPPRVLNVPSFLSTIEAIFWHLLADIPALRAAGRWGKPWVVVNAWAIFDTQSEHPPGGYSSHHGHPFRTIVANLARDGVDIVFCAGNCGQFCPDGRCGPRDFGPGHSILGANSYQEVLTVGAVRVDGIPLGYSSQGPGQPELCRTKPDLVGPSNFREVYNAAAKNTGTSAACAVVAGVVAALRERWGPDALTPEQLIGVLREAGSNPEWNNQTGHGVIDAEKAMSILARRP